MANEYTPNFRYRMPAIGDEFWADEFYQNQEIKDAVTKNHLVGAKVSGLLVTVNSGLSISWEAGQVFVNETIHNVNSGSVVLPPSGNVDILVPVYIYTDGINVVVSTVVPTLANGTLLAIADTDTQQIIALADTRIIGELFEYNDTFYIDPNGDDSASGSVTEPWQTIQGALDNVSRMSFIAIIKEVKVIMLDGTYLHNSLTGVVFPHLKVPIILEGNVVNPSNVIISVNNVGQLASDNIPVLSAVGTTKAITIRGLTITAIDNSGNPITAISTINCLLIYISDCVFEHLHTGILCQGSYSITSNLSFNNNFAFSVESDLSGHLILDDGIFVDCKNLLLSQKGSSIIASSIEASFTTNISSMDLFRATNNGAIEIRGSSIRGDNVASTATACTAAIASYIYAEQVHFTNFGGAVTCNSSGMSFMSLLSVSGITNYNPPINTVGNENSYIKV